MYTAGDSTQATVVQRRQAFAHGRDAPGIDFRQHHAGALVAAGEHLAPGSTIMLWPQVTRPLGWRPPWAGAIT